MESETAYHHLVQNFDAAQISLCREHGRDYICLGPIALASDQASRENRMAPGDFGCHPQPHVTVADGRSTALADRIKKLTGNQTGAIYEAAPLVPGKPRTVDLLQRKIWINAAVITEQNLPNIIAAIQQTGLLRSPPAQPRKAMQPPVLQT